MAIYSMIGTLLVVALGLALGPVGLPAQMAQAGDAAITTQVAAQELPEKKRTRPGLYVTAAEAAALLATRDDILLIDVRSPAETMLVGFPDQADVNIPFKTIDPRHVYKAKSGSYAMIPNPGFVPAVTGFLAERSPAAVLVLCRSGGRSAAAVDMLDKAGIDLPLYSVVDGFEGDRDKATGRRTVNGWKNAGAGWSDKLPAGFLQGLD